MPLPFPAVQRDILACDTAAAAPGGTPLHRVGVSELKKRHNLRLELFVSTPDVASVEPSSVVVVLGG